MEAVFKAEPGDEETVDCVVDALTQDKPRSFGGAVWCNKLATGHIVLIGDAAHAMPPTLGLGMNAGLVDVHLLAMFLSG